MNGVAGYTLDTTTLSAAAHTVTAAYSGNTLYLGSKASSSLTVTAPASALFTLTPATLPFTLPTGTSNSVQLVVTSLGTFSGNVSFAVTSTTAGAPHYALSASSVTITPTSSGSTTLTLYAYTQHARGTPRATRAMAPLPLERAW